LKHIPLRMCIVCRVRLEQSELRRFVYNKSEILVFNGSGRSFYICKNCINDSNEKSLKRSLSRVCKREIKDLEIVRNG
jgi:predicted RNA-binding protein YlxR (DUF448 family)